MARAKTARVLIEKPLKPTRGNMTTTKTKARGGRPSRAEASARAIAALAAAGIDAATVDPLLILQAIAADTSAPAGPRVAACRTLLAHTARVAAASATGDGPRPRPRD